MHDLAVELRVAFRLLVENWVHFSSALEAKVGDGGEQSTSLKSEATKAAGLLIVFYL